MRPYSSSSDPPDQKASSKRDARRRILRSRIDFSKMMAQVQTEAKINSSITIFTTISACRNREKIESSPPCAIIWPEITVSMRPVVRPSPACCSIVCPFLFQIRSAYRTNRPKSLICLTKHTVTILTDTYQVGTKPQSSKAARTD